MTNPLYYFQCCLGYFARAMWGVTRLSPPWVPDPRQSGTQILFLMAFTGLSPLGAVLFWVSPLWLAAFGKLRKNHIYNMRAYLAVAGFGFLLTAWFPEVAVAMLVPWALLSRRQARFFQDERAFWTQAFQESPENPDVLANYLTILRNEVRLELMRDLESPRVRGMVLEIEKLDPTLRRYTPGLHCAAISSASFPAVE